jgi:hypothetical protein
MPFVPLKRAFRPGAGCGMVSIISGHTHRSQRNAAAAAAAMIIVVLQRYERNARLGPTLGAGHKCFASCHINISFLGATFTSNRHNSTDFSGEAH